jgi:hypothetical protein
MLHTTEYLRDKNCRGDFTECALCKIAKSYGTENVPTYLYPNERFDAHNINLDEPEGGLFMYLKVIYPDGTPGMVRATTIGELIRTSKIIAYQCSEGWVELRRKKNMGYKGGERRELRLY